MRWMTTASVLAVLAALFVFPFPANTQRFVRVVYPAPGIGDGLRKRLEERDWVAELATVGCKLSRGARQDLEQALADATVLVQDTSMTVELKAHTRASVLLQDRLDALQVASELIAARLDVDAIELAYPKLEAGGRKDLLWQLHGSGFDAVTRRILADVVESERDPGVRAFAERLTTFYVE